MGFLNDLKKILFGTKSIAKSAARKTADYTKEKTEHLLDTSEDFFEKKKEDINERFDKIKTNTEAKSNEIFDNIKNKSKDVLENIKESEIYKKSTETAEKLGDVIADTGEKFIEKTQEFIEGPGNEIAEKFKDASEAIGSKIVEGGKTIFDKATEITQDLGEKLDKTIENAEKLAKSKAKTKDIDSEFADTEFDIKDSELGDKDEFFKKADKFAAGEYKETPEPKILETKSETKKTNVDIEGFEDRDNDGNPLIDEADIIEESQNDSPKNEKEEKK